jgi:hypothetical protein
MKYGLDNKEQIHDEIESVTKSIEKLQLSFKKNKLELI